MGRFFFWLVFWGAFSLLGMLALGHFFPSLDAVALSKTLEYGKHSTTLHISWALLIACSGTLMMLVFLPGRMIKG